MVGFKTGYYWFEVGKGEILQSFFSTVFVKIEKGIPGCLYPALNELYVGYLPVEHLREALREVYSIALFFEKMPTEDFVWDIKEPDSKPSATFKYNTNAKNLATFYITHEGEDLLNTMANAIRSAIKQQKPLEIQFIDDRFLTTIKFE